MAGAIVDAYADHLRTQVRKLMDIITKFARLLGATGRVVLDVEVQCQPLAAIIRQRMSLAVLIGETEIRRGLAYLERLSACNVTPEKKNHCHQRREY